MMDTKRRAAPWMLGLYGIPPWRKAGYNEMACGWCKGFIHEEWMDGMSRYVHDQTPVTAHEVLPYRVGR